MTLAQQLHNSASHAEGLDPACPVCTNQPKQITAADLRNGITIQHKGSGQSFTVHNVTHGSGDTVSWNGFLVGGDLHEHSFYAPASWPLELVADAPQPETVDITPESLKTAEGRGKVARAVDELDSATADVANAAEQLISEYETLDLTTLNRDDLRDLIDAIHTRREKQEAMLRALAGR